VIKDKHLYYLLSLIKHTESFSIEQLLQQKVGNSCYQPEGIVKHPAQSMPSQWTVQIPQDQAEPTLEN
jgi:hypothetical protein